MKLLKFLVIQLGPLFQYLIEEQMYEQFWDFFNLQDGTADSVS
jgi:hypothetical protein